MKKIKGAIKMKIRGLLLLMVFLLLSTMISLVSFAQTTEYPSEWPERLTITSGTMGGGWYPVMVRFGDLIMKEIPGLYVNVIEGGSLANTRVVNEGRDAQMGLTYIDVFFKARDGYFGDPIPQNISYGFGLMVAYQFVAVPLDSNIKTMGDIWDKRILGGIFGSGQDMFLYALADTYDKDIDKIDEYGGTLSGLSLTDSALQLVDGHGDVAFFGSSSLCKCPNIQEVEMSFPVRILEFEEGMKDKFLQVNPFYIPETIPAGCYKGQGEKPVELVGVPCVFIFNNKLPASFVKEIMRVLVNKTDQLQEEFPGALSMLEKDKYLKGQEVKYMHPGVIDLAEELSLPMGN